MNKLYDKIIWHNNTTPAINETNLNKMSKGIDDIDTRVVELADDLFIYLPQIKAYLDQAEDLVEALELMTANPPYIGANGNWYVWNTEQGAYVDSGVDASITITIADVTAIAPDAQPYVTNTGTNTDPIFHLFIPRGQKGDPGDGDMDSSVYDPNDDVADAGGIPAYIEDTIVANPQGTSVGDLTSIGINGSKYDIQGGDPNAYSVNDTVSDVDFADADKMPFYDASASGKKNSTWENVKGNVRGAIGEEMTLAQYNALSQAEKNDGKIRFITDVDDARVVTITGTMPSSATDFNINYPTGFNKENCIVQILYLTAYNYWYQDNTGAAVNKVNYYDGYITIGVNSTAFANRPYKIILTRF